MRRLSQSHHGRNHVEDNRSPQPFQQPMGSGRQDLSIAPGSRVRFPASSTHHQPGLLLRRRAEKAASRPPL